MTVPEQCHDIAHGMTMRVAVFAPKPALLKASQTPSTAGQYRTVCAALTPNATVLTTAPIKFIGRHTSKWFQVPVGCAVERQAPAFNRPAIQGWRSLTSCCSAKNFVH